MTAGTHCFNRGNKELQAVVQSCATNYTTHLGSNYSHNIYHMIKSTDADKVAYLALYMTTTTTCYGNVG